MERSGVLVESGQEAVRQLRYSPAVGSPHGVEVMDFAALRSMDTQRRRVLPQRPDFHVLALIASGTGAHEADFRAYRLRPGSAVWIRPGMVHRWSDIDACEGPLILFRPGFLPGLTAEEAGAPACRYLDPQGLSLALLAADHLRHEYEAAARAPLLASPALPAHLLAALVLRVLAGPPDRAREAAADDGSASGGAGGSAGGSIAVFRAYRAAVEAHFREWHQVADYARALGYDVRTLTRRPARPPARAPRPSSTSASCWKPKGCSPTPICRSPAAHGASDSATPRTSPRSSAARPPHRRPRGAPRTARGVSRRRPGAALHTPAP